MAQSLLDLVDTTALTGGGSEDVLRERILILLALLGAAAAPTQVAQAQVQERETTIPPEAVERELVVRFSRAYGMVQGAVEQHEAAADVSTLREPKRLDRELRQEIDQIMDSSGLSEQEWQGLLARMEKDRAFRDRVESLSTPFRYE